MERQDTLTKQIIDDLMAGKKVELGNLSLDVEAKLERFDGEHVEGDGKEPVETLIIKNGVLIKRIVNGIEVQI